MPRRTPFSIRKKKQQLQNARAAKRGDELTNPVLLTTKQKAKLGSGRVDAKSRKAAGIESKFMTVPPLYMERTRELAYDEPLSRPLPAESAVFPLAAMTNPAAADLTVPTRPKFKAGQTKDEVEKNEEGVFRKWLATTRSTVEAWVNAEVEEGEWPHSPSWFETNLEVWRQLWRVVESSAIVLLLCDARCVPLHCPPTLRTYLRSFKPKRQIILVLTKADLVDPAALEGWRTWLREWWSEGAEANEGDDVQIVSVMSYDTSLLYGQTKARHRPAIPTSSRGELIAALKTAHTRLTTPPDISDPEKLAQWTPPVRTEVDWAELARDPEPEPPKGPTKSAKDKQRARGRSNVATPLEGSDADSSDDHNDSHEDDHHHDPATEPLTIGLVGQPNVGKSSLLNAIMGTTRVRASKTPGKTKHFQTIFWGKQRHVKIVDCPGLVCPSLAPMELQAMAGILPISQIPSLPSCIYTVATHIALEDIFRVPHLEEDTTAAQLEAKRTWRSDMPRPEPVVKERIWTAGEIIDSRALDRGFFTAKGGRPDANRAGNGMLRVVADGRIRWGFWPPNVDLAGREGKGVYLAGGPDVDDEGKEEEESESEGAEHHKDEEWESKSDDEGSEEEDDDEDEDEESFEVQNNKSFFAALMDGGDDDDEDDDDDDEEEKEDEE